VGYVECFAEKGVGRPDRSLLPPAFDGTKMISNTTAITSAETYRPDMMLLDIGLPQTTRCGQEEDRRRSHEAGFDHHLVKPVEIDALKQLLAKTSRRS
jgi:DNA-binding response OmpR family regulator